MVDNFSIVKNNYRTTPKEVLSMKTIKFAELSYEARHFLLTTNSRYVSDEDEGIPLYLRQDDEAILGEDFVLCTKAVADFEKGAGAHNLYRGGAVIIVHSPYGQIVTYDDRYKWWKPIAGIAHFDEGSDLLKTAKRELMEELYILSCFDKKQKRYVPKGQKDASGMCTTLQFEGEVIELISEVKELEYYFNDENRAYECIATWILPDDMPGPWSCVNQEEWFLPGESGIVFATLHAGSISGFFSGQQGFVPISTRKLHPSMD